MAIIKFRQVGAAGLSLDVSPNDAPALPQRWEWTGAQNMRFGEGYAEMFLGHTSPHGAPTVTPYGVFFTNSASGLYEVYAGLTKIYAVADVTHTDITRALGNYTGTAADKWNGCSLSDILIMNNGVDDPQFWAGNVATPAAKLTNWPATTKCKVMRSFEGALVALNVTEGATNFKSMVRVSTSADPGTLPASWDYTLTTNDSIRVEGKLSETPDAIVDGLQLGNQFMIYKDNSTYAMRLVGGEQVYDFTNVSREFGALAVNCVTAFPGGHAVFSDGDLVVNSGAGDPQSIAQNRLRRWLFNNLDTDNRAKSFALTNKHRNEVWFCFPSVGSTWCNQAVVWNYKENTFGVRDLPNLAHADAGVINVTSVDTWDSRTDTWDQAYQTWGVNEYSRATKRVMMASTDTGLYLADVGISFAGAAMTSSVEHTGMDFGEPNRVKLCKGVRLRVDAPAGTVINVYVGSQDDLEDGIAWGAPMPFTVGTDTKVDPLVSGAYLAIKFETTAQAPWRISQFDLDIDDLGEVN